MKELMMNRCLKNTLLDMGIMLGLMSWAHAKDLPGASPTSYSVSPSGAFGFQIPIVVPQGMNNVQPNLALSFSSGGGNGSAGVGWGLSGLGSITRCGRTIATDGVAGGVLHNENDRFCLNGKRLIKVAGAGDYGAAGSEYRTEIDEISKIVAYRSRTNLDGGTAPNYFEVSYKNGMRARFGQGDNSRFLLPNGSRSIHAWRLTDVRDRHHNKYEVTYEQDYRIPSKITYAGNHEITFNYETRHDVRNQYLHGYLYTYDQRLDSVEVKRNSSGGAFVLGLRGGQLVIGRGMAQKILVS